MAGQVDFRENGPEISVRVIMARRTQSEKRREQHSRQKRLSGKGRGVSEELRGPLGLEVGKARSVEAAQTQASSTPCRAFGNPARSLELIFRMMRESKVLSKDRQDPSS
jgi:hypothetical protein